MSISNPLETHEMVFDAYDRAFAPLKSACQRGLNDNMKTAVETIFIGKERLYNPRFLQMCSHYLVDPVACTPASRWDEGQVEIRRAPHIGLSMLICWISAPRSASWPATLPVAEISNASSSESRPGANE